MTQSTAAAIRFTFALPFITFMQGIIVDIPRPSFVIMVLSENLPRESVQASFLATTSNFRCNTTLNFGQFSVIGHLLVG